MKKSIGIISVCVIALITSLNTSMAQTSELEGGGSNGCLTSPTNNVGMCIQKADGAYYCVRSFGTPNCVGD